jgi:hypothetical protein
MKWLVEPNKGSRDVELNSCSLIWRHCNILSSAFSKKKKVPSPKFYLPAVSSRDVNAVSFLPKPLCSLLLSIGLMSVTSQSIHWTEDPSILKRGWVWTNWRLRHHGPCWCSHLFAFERLSASLIINQHVHISVLRTWDAVAGGWVRTILGVGVPEGVKGRGGWWVGEDNDPFSLGQIGSERVWGRNEIFRVELLKMGYLYSDTGSETLREMRVLL